MFSKAPLQLVLFWALLGFYCISAAAPPVLHYPCAPVAQPAGGCDADCQQAIGTALLQLHAGLRGGEHTTGWYKRNTTALSLCTTHCYAVPAFCGWAGVLCCHANNETPPELIKSCRHSDVQHDVCQLPTNSTTPAGAVWKLDLTMQHLGGSLSDDVIDSLKVLTGYGLQAIDFSSNNLSGSIPERIYELGENFTTINLNFNNLTGTIPTTITRLPNLQHVFLSFNRLSGDLNTTFCTRPTDPLLVLIVRANLFNGSVDLTPCKELLLLDLTDNQLTGTLPVNANNGQLISFRATSNRFSGSIADDVWRLPMLTTIDLGSNDLTGTISEYCGTNNNLVSLYLGNNSLSGTLGEGLVGNSQLLILELQNNTSLFGTFPSLGALVGLRRLDIHNTSISGAIPDEWGHLPYLEYVDISGTRMTCCTTQEQADNASSTLPSFLQFSKRYRQFDLNSLEGGSRMMDELDDSNDQPNNILCRSVVRVPQPESKWNTLRLPVTTDAIVAQRWLMSPTYFFFKQCTCTKFYEKSSGRYLYRGVDRWWDEQYNSQVLRNVTPGPRLNMYIFYCAPFDSNQLKPGVRAAIAIAAFLVVFVVVGTFAYLVLAKASKFRRFLALSAIRIKGPPRSGRMSLVVTDIEGYSDIFKRSPEVMFKALVLHNTVLRAAKYYNGGFVLEQEGDSFTIAFYDPFDAVVFCLQAQQALLAVQWPPGLEAQDQDASNHGSNHPEGSVGSRKGSRLHMRLSPLLHFGPKMKRVNTTTSAASMGSHVDYLPSLTPSGLYHSLMSKAQLSEPLLFNGLRVRMGVVTGEVSSGTPIKNSALFQLAKVVGDFGNGGQTILDEATFAAIKDAAQALGAVDASGLNHSKLSSGRAGWNKLLRLCCFSRSYAPAEEVVLLDMGAFCRSSGTDDQELPYTTSRALDVKQPEAGQQPASPTRPWWQRLTLRPCGPCRSSSSSEGEASGDLSASSPGHPLPPAAQMSRPFLASTLTGGGSGSGNSSLAASLGGPSAGNPASSTRSRSSTAQQKQQLGDLREDVSDAAHRKQDVAVVGRLASFSARATRQWAELRRSLTRSQSFQAAQATRRDWESVRLFQVLPPPLAARAHAWHNDMNVKEGWICWDNIYFEAPGSTTAPLSGGNVDLLTSSNSCSGLQPGSTQWPLSATMASPSAAAGVAGSSAQPPAALGNADGSSSLQVQHTGGSDCSSTVMQPGAGPCGNSGSNPCLYPSPGMAPLPPVTMVFMAVEGPEQLVKRRRPFTPVVQALLNRVVRDALRRLGGYLCRVQEGDMKFMVAFASPVTALEWCLVVQIAAMYLPWPQSAIMLLPSCREQVDSSGRLVFRGPRLKMGVCEGVPRSILPDHEGRADYHGQSINMAARFMDKGARGGQIACTLELAQQAMAVWAAGGGSASFTDLHSPPGATHSIAEGQEHGGAAAAADAEADTACSPGQHGDQRSGLVPQEAATGRGCEGLQPLDIELPREQAAAVAAAPAGGSNGSGSGGGGSRPRPWWTAFTSPSAANLAAAAAAPGDTSTAAATSGNASTTVQPRPSNAAPHSNPGRPATAEPAAAGFGPPVEPFSRAAAATASASAPLPPSLQLLAGATSPGCSYDGPGSGSSMQAADAGCSSWEPGVALDSCSSGPAAGPVGPGSYWGAATSPGSPPGVAAAGGSGTAGGQGSRSGPGRAGQAAMSAAAAEEGGGQQPMDLEQRRVGGSWPGGLSAAAQQPQQQGQQRHPRIPARLWLSPRSRSNSQDRSSSAQLKQGSRSRLSSSNNAHGSRGGGSQASQQQQQQQQQQQAPGLAGMMAGMSSSGLSTHQLSLGGQQQQPPPPPPPPVAPSPFVMSGVVRVPFRVEVHRLGLFRFKGGPAQQEMVQVLPTHLLGRAQFIAAETPPPASRKGQLLQRLDGRVGEPVSVQLPVLAQDYHEHLNHRVSGITGLPHRCTSPTHTQHQQQASSADTAAAAPRRGMGAGAAARWGSRSVSLPAGRVLWSSGGSPEAQHTAAAAAAGPGPAGRVRSELGPDHQPPLAGPVSTGRDPGLGQLPLQGGAAVGTEQLPFASSSVGCTPDQGDYASTAEGAAGPSAALQQQQQQGVGLRPSGPAGTSKQHAQASAAAESCVVDVAGLGGLERHDSFRSVGDDGLAVGSDEEVGLSSPPAAAAGAGAVGGGDGSRSKSDPQLLWPPGTIRQASHG